MQALASELANDPAGLGYTGKTSVQIAVLLNARTQTTERLVIPSYEVIEATVPSEWVALTAAEKQRYQTIISAGQVMVKGPNTRATFAAMFGPGTATRANLAALQGTTASRADVLGLGPVTAGDVERALAGSA